MTFYKKLNWTSKDKRVLFREIRALKNFDWSTRRAPVIELRARLKTLQNDRCAYCQAVIFRDEVGFRDIDHILPKEPSNNPDQNKVKSNDINHRRITNGYSCFRYEPRNLVLACKMCNSSKGTYDALRDRTKGCSGLRYPKSSLVDWLNPHEMGYFDHIKINKFFFYEIVNGSQSGAAVIKECKLSDPTVLEKKFRPHAIFEAKRSSNLESCVYRLRDGVNDDLFGRGHAKDALIIARGLSEGDAERLIAMSLTEGQDLSPDIAALCVQLETRAPAIRIRFRNAIR